MRLICAALLAALVAGCAGTITASPDAPPSNVAAATPSAAASVAPSPTPTPRAPEPAATPTPTPAPTPTPTPEPWLTFKSKLYRFSIKYPPTWFATPGRKGFSDRLDDGFATVVFISRDTVASGRVASLAETAESEIDYMKSHYKTKLLSNKKVKVAGWSGRLLKFTGTDDGVKTYFQLLLLAKGRVGYFLEWRSPEDDRKADQALFAKIYKTFKPR